VGTEPAQAWCQFYQGDNGVFGVFPVINQCAFHEAEEQKNQSTSKNFPLLIDEDFSRI